MTIRNHKLYQNGFCLSKRSPKIYFSSPPPIAGSYSKVASERITVAFNTAVWAHFKYSGTPPLILFLIQIVIYVFLFTLKRKNRNYENIWFLQLPRGIFLHSLDFIALWRTSCCKIPTFGDHKYFLDKLKK